MKCAVQGVTDRSLATAAPEVQTLIVVVQVLEIIQQHLLSGQSCLVYQLLGHSWSH